MLQTYAREHRPKSLEALEDAIYNDLAAPPELQKYIYRREFGLSAQEMQDEPIEEFFLNMKIYALIKDKERITAEQNGKQR